MNRAAIILLALIFSACGIFKKKKKPTSQNSAVQKETYYQAELAYTNGNYEEAKQLFTKFTKESPKPASGFYRLGCISKLEKKYDDALHYCDLAIESDQTDKYYYDLLKADIYKASHNYNQAAEKYASLIKTNPRFWSLYSETANMYKLAGNSSGLLGFTRNWEHVFGIREEIVFFSSYAYAMKGHRDSIAILYQRLMQKYPERRQYKLSYAKSLQEAGKTQEAIVVYNEMLDMDPENAELLTNLCRFYHTSANEKDHWKLVQKIAVSSKLSLEEKQGCISSFLVPTNIYFDSLGTILNQMVLLHNTNSIAWQMLGDWTYEQRDFAAAINPIHQSLQLFSNYNLWMKYADCQNRVGNYTLLSKICDSMLELFPSNPAVYNLQAQAFLGLKKYKLATEACETGWSYAADNQLKNQINVTLARIMNLEGNKEAAISKLKSLVTDNSSDFLALITLIQMHLHNQDKSAEIEFLLNKAKELFPKSSNLNEAKSQYYLAYADFLNQTGNMNEAIKTLTTLLHFDPNNFSAWENLGNLRYIEGNKMESKKCYERAFQLNPYNIELKKKS
jgi:tetratricopeptide (TPR) repeat protein